MDDLKMERFMGYLLRTGVILAALVVSIGGALYLHQMRGPHPDYSVFHGTKPALRSPAGVLAMLPSGNSNAMIQFGLLLLIATPIARVIFGAYGFFAERDWLYVAVSLIVFVVLMYSLLHGH
jgi:uncharacterized membrane protein